MSSFGLSKFPTYSKCRRMAPDDKLAETISSTPIIFQANMRPEHESEQPALKQAQTCRYTYRHFLNE